MRSVFLSTVDMAAKIQEQEEDEDMDSSQTVGPSQVGTLLLDWTDPRKSVAVNDDDAKAPP